MSRHPLYEFILYLANLPQEEWDQFAPHVRELKMKKGDYFIRAGDPPSEVGFVHKGLFKRFFTAEDGKEYNQLFSAEREFIGSYSASLTGELSSATTQALEDSIVYSFPVKEFRGRFEKHAAWERLGRLAVESIFMDRSAHAYELLALPAIERLKSVVKRKPGLIDRLPNKEFATYLGITPESLSRLKKTAIEEGIL